MANEKYGKGIGVVSGFDLGAAAPVDSKYVVNNAAEMQAHVTNNRAYKGMQVYNLEDSKLYMYDGENFVDYKAAISNGVSTKVNISGDVKTTAATVGGAVESANITLSLKDSGVTAGTGTKVTVNAKGLVTKIANATTSDIAEGTNLYYTDARATANFTTNIAKTASTALSDGATIYHKGAKDIATADIVLDETHRFVTDAEKTSYADKYTKAEADSKIDEKIAAAAYHHPTSGVTKGTYRSVTVDANGHVTAGTNPTTLAGYGITDAKIEGGVITLGANTITPLTAHQSLANYYQKTQTYSQSEVDKKLSDLKAGIMVVVDGAELPATGDAGKIYLLRNDGTEEKNVFTEYVYVNKAWEKLGEQKLDLSPYVKKADADKAYLGINATAVAAAKLTTNAGSATQPVYFANGVPVATAHTVESNVPANAKFTDTTYSKATSTNDGLMSKEDKAFVDGVQAKLDLKANLASANFTELKLKNVVVATVTNVATAKGEAIAAAKTESDKKDSVKALIFAADGWVEDTKDAGVFTMTIAANNLWPTGLVCDNTGVSRLVDIKKLAAADSIVITSMEKFAGSVAVSTRH